MATSVFRNSPVLVGVFAASALWGCALPDPPAGLVPAMMAPAGPSRPAPVGLASQPVTDLTAPGAVVRSTATAQIIDTRDMKPVSPGSYRGPVRLVRDVLPPHGKPTPIPAGAPNDLPVGGVLPMTRAVPSASFPGIGQSGWIPPDCTAAAGPNHIVATVNMSIAFYKKDGTLQFYQYLDSSGNPGFFSSVGAGGFTFDPKCLYDQIARRFVVVAPEVYGPNEAWISIAVSDDEDPNGVWYKYRTDAVITVGTQTFWWDYPGFGYDQQGYYVTANLFGLNAGGWGGVGFRVFDKTPMLTGQPVIFSTMRDGGAASVQVAHHFGSPIAPYFVSVNNAASLRIHSITNPITAPTLVSTTVGIPGFSGPGDSATSGGSISSVDGRIFNAHWRNGKLYAAHHIGTLTPQGNRNKARWYQLRTNSWPSTGTVSFTQSGNASLEGESHAFFPAIASNAADEVGLVMGTSSPTTPVSVSVSGRKPTDPTGTMSVPVVLSTSPSGSAGRWGDYYSIAVDPANDTRFWVVGEVSEWWGWSTWIGSFTVDGADAPIAVVDDGGDAYPAVPVALDVLANDFDTNQDAFTLTSFDSASARGGAVARSVGTGPGGRDRLIYTAPSSGYVGTDTFNYSLTDAGGLVGSTFVSVNVRPAIPLRDPDAPLSAAPGLDAAYYTLTTRPTAIPDYNAMTPYLTNLAPSLDYAFTAGNFATSNAKDRVGARFTGYLTVPADGLYTVYLACDEGADFYIGDTRVATNPGPNNGVVETSGQIGLKAGSHQVRVDYYEWWQGQALIVSLADTINLRQVVPASMWSHAACPADYNGDGFVDGIDYDNFVGDFEAGSMDADFNQDGFIDGIDYDQFMVHFESGC